MGGTMVGLHQLHLPKETYHQIECMHIGLSTNRRHQKCTQTREIWRVELQCSPCKDQPSSESETDPIHKVQGGSEDAGNAVNSSKSEHLLQTGSRWGSDSPNKTSQKIACDWWGPLDFHKYLVRWRGQRYRQASGCGDF